MVSYYNVEAEWYYLLEGVVLPVGTLKEKNCSMADDDVCNFLYFDVI